MRKIRGDGNCYYRAIYVQYIEFLMLHKASSFLLLNFLERLIWEKDYFNMKYYGSEYIKEFKPTVVGFLY